MNVQEEEGPLRHEVKAEVGRYRAGVEEEQQDRKARANSGSFGTSPTAQPQVRVERYYTIYIAKIRVDIYHYRYVYGEREIIEGCASYFGWSAMGARCPSTS